MSASVAAALSLVPTAPARAAGAEGTASLSVHDGLRRRLRAARAETDALFALVREEAFYERPIPQRHRLVFYLGHLEAFDWNLLCRDGLGRAPFEPQLDELFAFGIDPLKGDLPTDKRSDWPRLGTVRRYAQRTRAALDDALRACAFRSGMSHPEAQDVGAVMLAIEHRLMHAETLAYLLHQLRPREKGPGPLPLPSHDCAPSRWVEVPAGTVQLGIEPGHRGFAWDNEYGAHDVRVPAFAIDSRNVTNGDFRRFVEAGGYGDPSLWSVEDWAWRKSTFLEHPRYWVERGGRWWYRAMFGQVPLGEAWPVYVSHAEAAAYARWRGCRLPTEAEYQRAAYTTPDGRKRSFPWGETRPAPRHGAFGFGGWDPTPAGSHPAGDTSAGVSDLVGNGWEWTSTPFGPFPGFQPLSAYPGYSADFFDGRHYVLKGASPRTPLSLVRRSFRNWFQPRYPFPYATFRCVEPRG
jgi:ergothioneine biosynthesis protein EgtB